MVDTLSHWVKAFIYCEIPVLYKSKRRIHDLQDNEQDITVSVLAEVAMQDPGFSISLLRYAGRSKKKEITTLSHAILLISIPLVIKMLTDAPVLEKVLEKTTASRILNEYAYQYQTAFMAKEWSILRKEFEHNEIFTAGLNRGFIRFILYLIEPEKAHKLEKIYLTPNDSYKIKEKELLGNSVDEIAQALAQKWKLPELIRESYSGKHHNPKITGIRLATELMQQIYSHLLIHYPEELINRIAEYIRIPANLAPGKVNRIIINAIRKSREYLPYQPLLIMMMSYPSSIKTKSNTKEVKNIPEKTVLSDYIKLLRSNNPNRTTRELIEIAVKAMRNGIGFSRVIFMSFSSSERNLKVRFQGIDNNLPNPEQLNISIELNMLFNQLLTKEQTLSINPKNQHKFSKFLPDKLQPMKPAATIIVNSFYVNNIVVGCFYIDHGQTDKQLTTNDLQSFNYVCTELKTAIESILSRNKSTKKVA